MAGGLDLALKKNKGRERGQGEGIEGAENHGKNQQRYKVLSWQKVRR